MRHATVLAMCLVCFLLGLAVRGGVAQSRQPVFMPELFQQKEPAAAAVALLDGALQLAGTGSWERIAVGRAWYLGGDKARGQQIFDRSRQQKGRR